MAPRRIAAIVLPKLACEIAKSRAPVKGPLAVLFEPTSREAVSHRGQVALPGFETAPRPVAKESAVIGAVCDEARRYGVRPGQRVAEATALVARLNVLTVTFAEIDQALGRVAEVAMAFGVTAAIQLSGGGRAQPGLSQRTASGATMSEERSPTGDGPFDTVWLDVTGAAHLCGGEDALLDALGERVSALGHTVHLALADGPRIAQALARWGVSEKGHLIAAPSRGADALAPLPIRALPLPPDRIAFLLRVGVLTIGDLVKLPRAEATSRLGPRGAMALAVASGFDPAPIVPYAPPPVLEEETSFDDSVESVEPVLFVLRATMSRLSARLEARGEACTRLDVELPYDASIARRALGERGEPATEEALRERFHVDLPAPISTAADLFRVVRTRLERTILIAPITGVRVSISEIARARKVQLDFARDAQADPNSLPALMAELAADIGPERVGVLALRDALRPEARAQLVPVKDVDAEVAEAEPPAERDPMCPARLLRTPVSLGRAGSSVIAVTGQLYVVERRRFIARLDDVEWWTDTPCSRNYFRATLSSGAVPRSVQPAALAAGAGGAAQRSVVSDALLFIDPRTEEAFLQGWFE